MTEPIIDDNIKAYLVACLVSGIYVEDEPSDFMTGLVDHMNSLTERVYWANGDEDGVILHDKFDVPVLSLIYSRNVLKFQIFQQDEYLETGYNRDAGLMLLNILGYIQQRGLESQPECTRTQTTIIPPSSQTESADDWSL